MADDLEYVDTIDRFTSVCFDIANDNLYTSKDNILLTFDYTDYIIREQFASANDFIEIYHDGNQLIYLQRNSSGEYFFTFTPELSSFIVPAEGVSLNKDSTYIRIGDTETLMETVLPDNATNQYVYWSTSDPLIATVDDGVVYANLVGTCEIIVTTLDGGHTASCTVTVLPTPEIGTFAASGSGLENLGFVPYDVAIDPNGQVAYMTEVDASRLYRVDLLTGDIQYMEFVFKAESLTVKNGKVYLGLLHRPHDYYIGNDGSGTIAVIDTSTFTLANSFDVVLDPYDIVADSDGIVYVGPGSGQWSKVASYNPSTGEKVSGLGFLINDRSLWDYNEQYNKLYSITTDSSPRDIQGYELSAGVFGDYYDSPYHGDYAMDTYIKISPDGQYIFNGSGNIFTCAPTQTGDMLFDGNIERFASVCFDLGRNAFYTVQDYTLTTYLYNERMIYDTFTAEDEFISIFYSNEQLIYLQKNTSEEYYFSFNPKEYDPTIYVESITLDKSTGMVMAGNSITLIPTITPADATNQNISWSTSNGAVATVTDGVVYGHTAGQCTITVTTEDGGFSASCNIEVIEATDKIAIIFGMADYAGTANDLNGPINDMIGLKAVLERAGYTVFKHMDYTAGDLLSRVEEIALGIPAECTLLFAYSGHGADDGYLFGSDLSAISINALESRLSLHTGVKEVIIDACFSGDFIGKSMEFDSYTPLETQGDFNDYVISVFSKSETGMNTKNLAESGYYVLTASTGSQISYELLFNIPDAPFPAANYVQTIVEDHPYYWLGYFSAAVHDSFGLYDDTTFAQFHADSDADGFLTWNEVYEYTESSINDRQDVQVYPDNSEHIICQKDYPAVTSVALTAGTAHIDIGETLQLIYEIQPSDAPNQNVTYTSDNESVVFVSSTGLVTGISLGTATITVTTEDGEYTDTCQITSGYLVESVELLPDTLEVNIGDYEQLTTNITPSNATNQIVTYTSGDETVATVDAIGVVWTHAEGTATITVTTQDGGFTDTCQVTVVKPVTGVELSHERHSMLEGDTFELTATVMPEDATNKNVIFTSSDTGVATVDAAGLVTSTGLGTATITVTTQEGSFTDTCEVIVAQELIASEIYLVDRISGYLVDIAMGATVQDIIDAIDNTIGEIHIFDTAMQELTEGNVSTGYYVQLIVDGQVVDELLIIIEGDINPDGMLDVIDYTLIRLHILEVSTLFGIALEAADVNNDGVIDVIDYTLVRLHILQVMPLYGEPFEEPPLEQ